MTYANLHLRRSVPLGTAGLTYDVPALNEAPVLAGVWWSGVIAPRNINISDKCHASTSSPQGNEPSVPIGQRGRMTTEPVGSWYVGCRAVKLVTALTGWCVHG